MSLPGVEFLDFAARELDKARRWYARRSPEAAERFSREVDRVIHEIRKSPERWPRYLHGTKCCAFRKFPYLIVYRETGEVVHVIAVAHGHRKPGYWKRRLKGR